MGTFLATTPTWRVHFQPVFPKHVSFVLPTKDSYVPLVSLPHSSPIGRCAWERTKGSIYVFLVLWDSDSTSCCCKAKHVRLTRRTSIVFGKTQHCLQTLVPEAWGGLPVCLHAEKSCGFLCSGGWFPEVCTLLFRQSRLLPFLCVSRCVCVCTWLKSAKYMSACVNMDKCTREFERTGEKSPSETWFPRINGETNTRSGVLLALFESITQADKCFRLWDEANTSEGKLLNFWRTCPRKQTVIAHVNYHLGLWINQFSLQIF